MSGLRMTRIDFLRRMGVASLMLFALQALPVAAHDKQEEDKVALLEAVLRDDAKGVERLILQGVDPNVREVERGPAIVLAATENSFNALRELLKAPGLDLEATNARGETALMMAAFRGHDPSVQRLIEKGAAVNRSGWTPLQYAASNGRVDTIQLLIKSKADLDAVSDNGTTAMMLAARMGHLSAYQELLLAGADPTLRNQSGLSAADYLDRRGETDRAERLRRYAETFKKKTP
ncbi:MAG: ankyrin repeat domain-containing protein [Burkholderiaceae bacterium]